MIFEHLQKRIPTENYTRKQTGFGHTQENSCNEQAIEVFDQTHQSHLLTRQQRPSPVRCFACTHDNAPGYHNRRQPDRGSQPFQQHVTRNFKSAICEEESYHTCQPVTH